MRFAMMAVSLSVVALLSGCATPNGGPPESGYSVFFDQGDHLKNLVAKKDFDGAIKLYNEQEAYFVEHQAKLAPLLDQAAAGYNAQWQPKIDAVVSKILAITWPAPREKWPEIKNVFAEAKKVVADYGTAKLTAGPRRVDGMGGLQQAYKNIAERMIADAPRFLKTEDLASGRNFFFDYPIHGDLLTAFIERLQASFDVQNYDDKILAIAKAYSGSVSRDKGVKPELSREVSELIRFKASRVPLSEIVAFYRRAAAASIAPQTLPVSVAVYSSSIGGASFQSAIERDIPFEWHDVSLSGLGGLSADVDFVVVMGPVRAAINRKVGDYSQINSRYLAGYRTDPNPDYKQAMLNMQRAEQVMANARSQQIASSNDITCNAAGCQQNPWSQLGANIGMIAAQNNYNDAQRALSNTPQTVQTPVYQAYSFDTAVITATKDVDFVVYVGKAKAGASVAYAKSVNATQSFKVAYKVNDQDTNRSSITSSYSTEAAADGWEKQPISMKLSDILAEGYQKSGAVGWQQVTANFEHAGQAFSTNVTQQKGPSAAASAADKGDRRFSTVVVIKTASTMGSGFFVTGDTILTNAHVVEGQRYVTMKTYEGVDLSGKVEAIDKRRDLALVKTQGTNGVVKLSTKEVAVGGAVEVVGHPKGLQYTLTRGIVSQVRTLPPVSGIGGGLVSYIQLDASISPGNSGGPVFQNGEVIGVATWKLASKDAENLNFAIHRDEVMSFLRENGVSP